METWNPSDYDTVGVEAKLILKVNPSFGNVVDENGNIIIKPIYNTINGYKVISMFESATEHSSPGRNTEAIEVDINDYILNFIEKTPELNVKYDTIIVTCNYECSEERLMFRLAEFIPHTFIVKDWFFYCDSMEVYEDFLDSDWLDKTYQKEEDKRRVRSTLVNGIINMNNAKSNGGNDGFFSFKFLPDKETRNAVACTIRGTNDCVNADRINNRNVLILDISDGKQNCLSESAHVITNVYDPKSITFLTLFSPLTKQ